MLSPAEIIDRIAVTIGTQVITESEINREIRLTAFLNGERAVFSPVSRRKAADRLIEQKLVKREQELSRYPAPQPSEVEALFREIQARYASRAALDQALASYGLTELDIRDHLLWQLTLLRFVDVRFRPGIQIAEEDIRQYYEKNLKSSDGSMEQYRDKIEQVLIQERIDQDLDRWLRRARERAKIEFRKDLFPWLAAAASSPRSPVPPACCWCSR